MRDENARLDDIVKAFLIIVEELLPPGFTLEPPTPEPGPEPPPESPPEPPPEAPPEPVKEYHAIVKGGFYADDPYDKKVPTAIRCNNPGALNTSKAVQAKALAARTEEIAKQATDKGLVRADDPVPDKGDKREPPVSLTTDWYKKGRIQDQIDYYRGARERNQRAADALWWVAFAAGLAAVVFGALGAWAQRFAPWIGAMTTIAASIAAYGLIDRRKYLIGSYAAMQSSLERILGLDEVAPLNIVDLVITTEDLLEGEHRAWLPQMLARQHQPQTQQQSKQEA